MSQASISDSPVVITGIAPVCRHAVSIAELQKANAVPECGEPLPSGGDDWFDPARFLGARGYKYWTQATRYILAATGLALQDAGLSANPYGPNDIGVCLGTNFANSKLIQELDRTALTEGPELLSPMIGPNFSINIPSSMVSIKYGFKAFNITLTTALVAGLEALICAKETLLRGRAKMVIAGALEDTPPSPVNELLGNTRGYGGACAFVLEPLSEAVRRDAKIYAKLGRGSMRFINPEILENNDRKEWGKNILRQMMDDTLPGRRKAIDYLSLTYPLEFNRKVNQYLCETLTEKNIEVHIHNYLGADGSHATVSPLLQLAITSTKDTEGLIVAASPQGHVVSLALNGCDGDC
jgi:hypothetical protein